MDKPVQWRNTDKHLFHKGILADWVNLGYLELTMINAIAEVFAKEHVVQLQQFLDKLPFLKLQDDIECATGYEESILNMHNFTKLHPRSMMSKFNNVLHSQAFQQLLSLITGQDFKIKKVEWLSFSKGQYTLLCDDLQQQHGLYVIVDLESLAEECGGFTCVMQDDQELARIIPTENSMFIFSLPKQARYFTKYLNHKTGKKKRLFVVARFSK